MKKEYFFEVILWWACNLDCSYCYQKDSPLYWKNKVELLKTSKTNKDNLLKIIKLINDLSWDDITIWVIIYWWEPFVHKDNLIFFIEKFFNSGIKNITDLSILSNWTIVDHDILSVANKYNCYIDVCWHIKTITDLDNEFIFWKSHSDFLDLVQKEYKNVNLITHLVITDKILDKLDIFLNYYNKRIPWKNLIIWFDYVYSNWEDKINLSKIIKFLLDYKKNKYKYNFRFRFEPFICKAWTFTARHQSSWWLHILPNGDIFWCWYVSLISNIKEEKYKQLKISSLNSDNLLYKVKESFYKNEQSYKILCEREENGPYFPCYLKRKGIIMIWKFVTKYMKEFCNHKMF